MKLTLRPQFMAPVTADGKLPDLTGIAAISLRNGGDSTVNIANGRWTLDAKETLSLNVTEDYAGMDIQDVQITFSGGSTNLLQIVVLTQAPC